MSTDRSSLENCDCASIDIELPEPWLGGEVIPSRLSPSVCWCPADSNASRNSYGTGARGKAIGGGLVFLGGPPDPVCECSAKPAGSSGTGGIGPIQFQSLAVANAIQVLAETRAQFESPLPSPPFSPAAWNPVNGNGVFRLEPATAGSLDPQPQFRYNSLAAETAIQFGHGVAEEFNRTVSSVSTNEAVIVNGGRKKTGLHGQGRQQ